MSISLRARGGARPIPSRIIFEASLASSFRLLCRHTGLNADQLLEDMMSTYVKQKKLPISIVKTRAPASMKAPKRARR